MFRLGQAWTTLLTLTLLATSCSAPGNVPELAPPTPPENSSQDRLHARVPVEDVDIQLRAERSGHSLVVRVQGVARGHGGGEELENPKAWLITATNADVPLRQVLAGPAKVTREPTGGARTDQWNVEIQFMVAFALPDRACTIDIQAQAPSGERANHKVSVAAPLERLSHR